MRYQVDINENEIGAVYVLCGEHLLMCRIIATFRCHSKVHMRNYLNYTTLTRRTLHRTHAFLLFIPKSNSFILWMSGTQSIEHSVHRSQ